MLKSFDIILSKGRFVKKRSWPVKLLGMDAKLVALYGAKVVAVPTLLKGFLIRLMRSVPSLFDGIESRLPDSSPFSFAGSGFALFCLVQDIFIAKMSKINVKIAICG
jgi:hypothetical protein